ncbi:hypothetical protein APS_0791 [Acetobacter pasteurianus subsp. pasteurianus LMG 1262 = NBRC 106471]|nr:hypothetical protein APS_0791 [Acetobacter pasteurianus subsp. pasteurianus LMG 1262 = NBRC 106471]
MFGNKRIFRPTLPLAWKAAYPVWCGQVWVGRKGMNFSASPHVCLHLAGIPRIRGLKHTYMLCVARYAAARRCTKARGMALFLADQETGSVLP